jgi:type III pantothenate kinase
MIFHSFLLVDVGNSRIKWATAKIPDAPSLEPFHLRTPLPVVKGDLPTSEATQKTIRALKEKYQGHYLVLSSVVPKLTPLFCRLFKRGFHVVTGDSPTLGLSFDYPNPSELGADRIAAVVAAETDRAWPAIVVSCGTATAFSVLNEKGRFCGGAIAPGLKAQLDALVGSTAQLPAIAMRHPRRLPARSTEEAIRAGVILNFIGGTKEIIRSLSAELSGPPPRIILTGGNADYLAKSLGLPHTLRPLLVFEGLRIIGNRIWNSDAS